MTPAESARIIEAAGGDTEFAKLLGLTEAPGFKQRVNNWKRRGIPADVILANYDAIQQLANIVKPDRATA